LRVAEKRVLVVVEKGGACPPSSELSRVDPGWEGHQVLKLLPRRASPG
jgi:hypothetical protein